MYELSFRAIRPSAECGSAELLFAQPGHGPRHPPTPAFAGQTHEAFDRHLGPDNERRPIAGTVCTLGDATLIIHPGLDGVVLSAGGDLVFETCVFTDIERGPGCIQLGRAGPGTTPLPDAFVAFDAAWTNYYHWLCLTVPRMVALRDRCDFRTRFVLPSHRERAGAVRFSETVWRQSLDCAGLALHVTELPTGVYRAARLHLLWTTPADPTAFTETDAFRRAAARMGAGLDMDRRGPAVAAWRRLASAAGLPRRRARFILSRGDNVDPRIDPRTRELLDRIARPLGFERVAVEALDLRGQAELFRNARCIIAPHGAGLGNIMFGSPGLRVLELGTALDSDGSLRPWFYLLAHSLGHRYMILDGGAGQFSEPRLREAVARLIA